MQVRKSDDFKKKLQFILEYIAKDKIGASLKFRKELNISLKNLGHMPYKFKQSIYFNDKNIRDMIFKGYVVVYKIDIQKDTIIIVGINKYKKDLV